MAVRPAYTITVGLDDMNELLLICFGVN
jgi:hypothetical protein